MSAFKTKMKSIVQDLVGTNTKKEIQQAKGELRVLLLLEIKEVLEKHLVTIRQEILNMLKDSRSGGQGNQQIKNRNGNHKKVSLQELQENV